MKISIYELLGMVKDGKAPKNIKYREMIYHICYEYGDYESDIEDYRFADAKKHYYLFEGIDMLKCLNDTVEIIEEKTPTQEEINEYTNKFLEAWKPVSKQFGKLFDELLRIKNDLGLNLEDEIEEEKEIPEKLPKSVTDNACSSKDMRLIAITINQLIDYLKSKGE